MRGVLNLLGKCTAGESPKSYWVSLRYEPLVAALKLTLHGNLSRRKQLKRESLSWRGNFWLYLYPSLTNGIGNRASQSRKQKIGCEWGVRGTYGIIPRRAPNKTLISKNHFPSERPNIISCRMIAEIRAESERITAVELLIRFRDPHFPVEETALNTDKLPTSSSGCT
jgi:hypothetical protein